MSTTRSNFYLVLALVAAAIACAAPEGISVPAAKKQTNASGSSSKSSTEETSSSGGTEAKTSSPGSGGAAKKTTSGEGGGSGVDTTASETGGTENTNTDTPGSGGTTDTTDTTSTPTATSCEGSLQQVTVTATSAQSGASGSTTIVPTEGASIAVADIGVKFCFTISSNMTAAAFLISYASITLKIAPYNVEISTAKVTLEAGSDGASCVLIDVAKVAAAAALTMDSTATMKLDWRLDHTVVGTSVPDPSKPAQFIVTNGSAVAGCGDVPLKSSP